MIRNILARVGAAAAGFAVTSAVAAPQPWEWTFQPAATDMMKQITWFQDYTLWFIVPIVILVMALLGYCIIRFSAKRNPVPSKTTHNTMIEVLWTVLPVVVLLFIANDLRMFAFGEEDARAHGVDVERVKLIGFGVASIITGASVAVGGIIPFVGLLVPHLVRLAWRRDYRFLLPLCAIVGAMLLVASDLISRIARPPIELPVGAIMALIGVPFFVSLLRGDR